MQSVTITTQPTIEPITVTETKHFMRVDITDDDDLISDLIVTARAMCEEYTRRKFISTSLTLSLDGFPCAERDVWWNGVRDGAVSELYSYETRIKLPYPPVVSVTSITTYNADNSPTVISSSVYRLDTDGNVLLNDGQMWASNLRNADAVKILYTAGYGATPSSVPTPIRQAIKMTVAAIYDDRACASIPHGAMIMLDMYRVVSERRNGV